MFITPLALMIITTTSSMVNISGDWSISVPALAAMVGDDTICIKNPTVLQIAPPSVVSVVNEEHKSLAEFKPEGRWMAGNKLAGTAAMECSVPGAVQVDSIRVKSSPDGQQFVINRDYEVEPLWGLVGRLEGGSIKADTPVYIDYTYHTCRIDSIVVDQQGQARLVKGEDNVFWAQIPPVPEGCKQLVNIWVPGYAKKLTEDMIYPIREPQYYTDKPSAEAMRAYIPNTWKKLTTDGSIKILAWGDSVTDGGYLPSQSYKWQNQFVDRLRKAYPEAKIELTSVAWGGKASPDFMAEPPGSPKNFKEKILDAKPDLVISEFINDCGHYQNIESLTKGYSVIKKAFADNGIEWIVMTPHYDTWAHQPNFGDKMVRDTRPYVWALREYAMENNIALADASLRWDHLALEGVPYTTLLLNAINHPSAQGMKLYADALMDIFGK